MGGGAVGGGGEGVCGGEGVVDCHAGRDRRWRVLVSVMMEEANFCKWGGISLLGFLKAKLMSLWRLVTLEVRWEVLLRSCFLRLAVRNLEKGTSFSSSVSCRVSSSRSVERGIVA